MTILEVYADIHTRGSYCSIIRLGSSCSVVETPLFCIKSHIRSKISRNHIYDVLIRLGLNKNCDFYIDLYVDLRTI